MKHVGRWIALLGIVLAAVLFQREGFGTVVNLLRVAGYGLVVAALFHVVPMILNARGWQALMQTSKRVALPTLVLATWMRESVNGLLPVARVGGEVAAYRLLIRRGIGSVPVAASLIGDLVVSVISQSLFTLLGLGLLIGLGLDSRLAWPLAAGFTTLFTLGTLTILFQESDLTARALRWAGRAFAGRWSHVIDQSARLDEGIQSIYERRRSVMICLGWQLAGWIAGAGEILIALVVLGRPPSIAHALLIEAVIQTVSSVAFVVPGALGVQEGGFLLVGAALGLDGPTSLALAAARRLRDVIVFVPGLLVWSWLEGRRKPQASLAS